MRYELPHHPHAERDRERAELGRTSGTVQGEAELEPCDHGGGVVCRRCSPIRFAVPGERLADVAAAEGPPPRVEGALARPAGEVGVKGGERAETREKGREGAREVDRIAEGG